MRWMPSPPEKTSELSVYRLLSKHAGVRVSPFCLGAMNIGDAWSKSGMGAMSKEASFELLDAFIGLGGNFIDTASGYQDEQSEKWIGEWMTARGNRDDLVIATKFTTYYKLTSPKIRINYTGNHIKSLRASVRDSLAKLQTDYIDILYVHWWDYTTSIEELMQGLDALVKSGKVLYLGVSDTPAWVVSKANQYAKDHGMAQFVIYQGRWSVLDRDFEREIIPLCVSEGMALAPWGAMGAGKFQTQAELERRQKSGEGLRWGAEMTEKELAMSKALEDVGKQLGTTSVTAVALAYVMQKIPYVFPIVGGRKVEYLKANIEALSLHLTPEQIKQLEAVTSDFDVGFPSNMIGTDSSLSGELCWLLKMAGDFKPHPAARPIGAAEKK